MLTQLFPKLPEYMQLMDVRPHVQRTMRDRDAALAAFVALRPQIRRVGRCGAVIARGPPPLSVRCLKARI